MIKQRSGCNAIFTQKGRLYSLQVLETILTKGNGYFDQGFTGNNFMVAQQKFMMGESVFHYNGDYFVDEMKDTLKDMESANISYSEVNMMRTPIISKITETFENPEEWTDEKLSAVIKAIDNGATSYDGVSEYDFDKICEARGIVGSVGPAPAIIPTYAKAKDVAVDFLRFMGTDIGIAAYAKGTEGSTIDFKCNLKEVDEALYNDLSLLHKDRLDFINASNLTVTLLRKGSTYSLHEFGSVRIFADEAWDEAFISGSGITAQKIYDDTIAKWDGDTFDAAVAKAGLNG